MTLLFCKNFNALFLVQESNDFFKLIKIKFFYFNCPMLRNQYKDQLNLNHFSVRKF